jgi:hypothetical protein
MKAKILSIIFISFSLLPFISKAQLFNFTFGTVNTTTCVTPGNSVTVANATVTPITRTGAAGFTCNEGTNCLNTRGWSVSAINLNQYLEVTVTPNAGYRLNITSVNINASKSSTTGPDSARIAHNGSGNFTTVFKNFTPSSSATNVTWNNFSPIITQGSISFRIYGWRAGASTGTMRLGSFALYGTISLIPVPTISDSVLSLTSAALKEIPFVLRYKDTLQLSVAQQRSLVYSADTIKVAAANYYIQNPLGKYPFAEAEGNGVRTILSTSQYAILLAIKNNLGYNRTTSTYMANRELFLAIKYKDSIGFSNTQTNNLLLAYDSIRRNAYTYVSTHPGQYFNYKSADSLVIKNNLTSVQIKILKEIRTGVYFETKASFISQFALAIKFKDTIGISASQIAAIKLSYDTLKQIQKDSANSAIRFDGRAFESSRLNNLLTSAQYTLLLILKNKPKAKVFALNDWKEMEIRGIAVNFNKDSSINLLTNFYTARESTYNRYQHDKVQQSNMIRYLYANKPTVLNALFHARRNPDNNTQGQGYQW